MDRLDELEKLHKSIEHSRRLIDEATDNDDYDEHPSRGVMDDLSIYETSTTQFRRWELS